MIRKITRKILLFIINLCDSIVWFIFASKLERCMKKYNCDVVDAITIMIAKQVGPLYVSRKEALMAIRSLEQRSNNDTIS